MKLYVKQAEEGDSLAILNEKYVPKNYQEVTLELLKQSYNFNDLCTLMVSLNNASFPVVV